MHKTIFASLSINVRFREVTLFKELGLPLKIQKRNSNQTFYKVKVSSPTFDHELGSFSG